MSKRGTRLGVPKKKQNIESQATTSINDFKLSQEELKSLENLFTLVPINSIFHLKLSNGNGNTISKIDSKNVKTNPLKIGVFDDHTSKNTVLLHSEIKPFSNKFHEKLSNQLPIGAELSLEQHNSPAIYLYRTSEDLYTSSGIEDTKEDQDKSHNGNVNSSEVFTSEENIGVREEQSERLNSVEVSYNSSGITDAQTDLDKSHNGNVNSSEVFTSEENIGVREKQSKQLYQKFYNFSQGLINFINVLPKGFEFEINNEKTFLDLTNQENTLTKLYNKVLPITEKFDSFNFSNFIQNNSQINDDSKYFEQFHTKIGIVDFQNSLGDLFKNNTDINPSFSKNIEAGKSCVPLYEFIKLITNNSMQKLNINDVFVNTDYNSSSTKLQISSNNTNFSYADESANRLDLFITELTEYVDPTICMNGTDRYHEHNVMYHTYNITYFPEENVKQIFCEVDLYGSSIESIFNAVCIEF